jgi:hypothetical protein
MCKLCSSCKENKPLELFGNRKSSKDGLRSQSATQCEFMENGEFGVGCKHMLSKAILDDCTVHDNVFGGLSAFCYAVVDLHGTKTDIHSNGYDGIVAM